MAVNDSKMKLSVYYLGLPVYHKTLDQPEAIKKGDFVSTFSEDFPSYTPPVPFPSLHLILPLLAMPVVTRLIVEGITKLDATGASPLLRNCDLRKFMLTNPIVTAWLQNGYEASTTMLLNHFFCRSKHQGPRRLTRLGIKRS